MQHRFHWSPKKNKDQPGVSGKAPYRTKYLEENKKIRQRIQESISESVEQDQSSSQFIHADCTIFSRKSDSKFRTVKRFLSAAQKRFVMFLSFCLSRYSPSWKSTHHFSPLFITPLLVFRSQVKWPNTQMALIWEAFPDHSGLKSESCVSQQAHFSLSVFIIVCNNCLFTFLAILQLFRFCVGQASFCLAYPHLFYTYLYLYRV